ncbi:MAG: hypothetical protein ABR541_05285 [Candidatus Dormibacteria bacterium]
MIVFALVLATLVLLALLADRFASGFWNRAHPRGPLILCPACGVRHPADRVAVAGGVERCPRGHAIVAAPDTHGRVATAAIFVLAAFVVCGLVLVLAGVVAVS